MVRDKLNYKDNDTEKNTVGLDETEIQQLNNIQESQKGGFTKSLFEWVDSFVVSFIAVVILFTVFFGKVRVNGDSMKETLHDKDQLIITDFMYTPDRGDIVIISRNPQNVVINDPSRDNQPIVKRVIAIAGDTIEITKDGKVLLNDVELDEPYIKDYAQNLGTPQRDMTVKLEVPEGRIFVMGDNRHDSHDSRYVDIWLVDTRYVLGKVLCRIYPFDQINTF